MLFEFRVFCPVGNVSFGIRTVTMENGVMVSNFRANKRWNLVSIGFLSIVD